MMDFSTTIKLRCLIWRAIIEDLPHNDLNLDPDFTKVKGSFLALEVEVDVLLRDTIICLIVPGGHHEKLAFS